MSIYIIQSDYTAISDVKKPERGRMTKPEFREALKRWSNRNRYKISESFTDINDMEKLVGTKIEGELRNGILYPNT